MKFRDLFWLSAAGLWVSSVASFSLSVSGNDWLPDSTITVLIVMSTGLFGEGPKDIGWWIVPLWVPFGFLAWCWPLQHEKPWLPLRSLVLWCAVALLTLLSLRDLEHALTYRSERELLYSLAGNIVLAMLTSWAAFQYRREQRQSMGLIFHAGLFLWLATFAVPFLGAVE